MENPINLFLQLYGDLGIPIHSRELTSALIKNTTRDINITPIYPAQDPKDKLSIGKDIKDHIKPAKVDGNSFVFWYPNIYDELLGIYNKNIGYYIFEYNLIPKPFVTEINKLDMICTASDWGCSVLKDNGVKIPILKIRGGINPETFNTNYRKEWNGVEPFKFLTIGKCEKRKGTELTVSAFLKLFEGNKNVTLSLSIDNPHIPFFSAETWLKANFPGRDLSNIKILGKVKDIRELYSTHHCCVFPTRAEGIGLPIVESIACGIPTIATNNSGTSEFLKICTPFSLTDLKETDVYDPHFFPNKGEYGTWLEPKVEEIVNYMHYIYKNYQSALDMATRSSKYISTHFTWDQAAKQFLGNI